MEILFLTASFLRGSSQVYGHFFDLHFSKRATFWPRKCQIANVPELAWVWILAAQLCTSANKGHFCIVAGPHEAKEHFLWANQTKKSFEL